MRWERYLTTVTGPLVICLVLVLAIIDRMNLPFSFAYVPMLLLMAVEFSPLVAKIIRDHSTGASGGKGENQNVEA